MAGSEISTDFTVDKIVTNTANYVPTESFLNNYWSIAIGILIIIGVVSIILKRKKKHKRKKVSRKRKKK